MMTNARRSRLGVAAAWVVACVIPTPALAAPTIDIDNGGFERAAAVDGSPGGWTVSCDAQGDRVVVDSSHSIAGARSAKIERASVAGQCSLAQAIPAARYRGGHLRLTGSVRTADAQQGAGLWLRADRASDVLAFANSHGRGDAAIGTTAWRRQSIDLDVPAEAETIVFGAVLGGAGTAWFDALELRESAIPAHDTRSPAEIYLRKVLDLLERHSLRRRHADWPALRRVALQRLGTTRDIAQTYPIILATLRSLGDRHSFLIPPASLGTSYPTGRQPREAPPKPAMLAADVGFVFVPGFMGGTRAEEQAFAQAVQKDIAEQDTRDTCGWIVDLRRDVGGNMWPMLVGLGPLLPSGPLGYFRDARGRLEAWSYGDGRAFQAGRETARLQARAYVTRRPRTPLAILIGPSTASSGEAVAIALHAAPRSRWFGMPSAGFTTGNATFALPDGAMLLLETTRFVDKAKSVLDGPLQPDEPVGSSGGADAALVEAQAWLHSACRRRH